MKLGLIGLATVTALVMRVSAKEYYMASVFIYGVNVGEDNYEKDYAGYPLSVYVSGFQYVYGSVRFRFMIFQSFAEKNNAPSSDSVNWTLIYITDFDVSLRRLGKELSVDLFKDLKIDCKINTDLLKDQGFTSKLIENASFSILRKNNMFNTEGTHVASVITSIDLSKDVKFSVFANNGLEIRFHKEEKLLQGSILDFKIHLEKYTSNCQPKKTDPKFFMKAEEIKYNKDKANDKIWKNAKKKILSGFIQNKENSKSFVPFIIKSESVYMNAILVVDKIPIQRLYKTGESDLNIEYNFPFEVTPIYTEVVPDIYSHKFKKDTKSWKRIQHNKFESPAYSDIDLNIEDTGYDDDDYEPTDEFESNNPNSEKKEFNVQLVKNIDVNKNSNQVADDRSKEELIQYYIALYKEDKALHLY